MPEISGANGQGETIEEAKDSLREAIELNLEDRTAEKIFFVTCQKTLFAKKSWLHETPRSGAETQDCGMLFEKKILKNLNVE